MRRRLKLRRSSRRRLRDSFITSAKDGEAGNGKESDGPVEAAAAASRSASAVKTIKSQSARLYRRGKRKEEQRTFVHLFPQHLIPPHAAPPSLSPHHLPDLSPRQRREDLNQPNQLLILCGGPALTRPWA